MTTTAISERQRQTVEQYSAKQYAERFQPGSWLDKKLFISEHVSAVSGSYLRDHQAHGSWYSQHCHYFDLSLGKRPADNTGNIEGLAGSALPMGEILFVPAGQRFYGHGQPGKQRNLFVFLQARKLPEHEQTDGSQPLENLTADILGGCLDLRHTRIRLLLKQFARELYHPEFATQFMLEGLGSTLLAEVVRLLHRQKSQPKKIGGLSAKAMRLIKNRIDQPSATPCLAELAELCQISARHLTRAFQEETGQTIGHFIHQQRMQQASKLLRQSNISIAEIANQCGYTSPAAFTSAFRKTVGQSPRQFRANHRLNDTVVKPTHSEQP